jgi:hypothetical protein
MPNARNPPTSFVPLRGTHYAQDEDDCYRFYFFATVTYNYVDTKIWDRYAAVQNIKTRKKKRQQKREAI